MLGLQEDSTDNRMRNINAVFITAYHWDLSWARWIKSTHFQPAYFRTPLKFSPHLTLALEVGPFILGTKWKQNLQI